MITDKEIYQSTNVLIWKYGDGALSTRQCAQTRCSRLATSMGWQCGSGLFAQWASCCRSWLKGKRTEPGPIVAP